MDLEGLNGKALLSLSYKFHPSHETKDGKIFPPEPKLQIFYGLYEIRLSSPKNLMLLI